MQILIKRAFTMMELMTVVMILGVIAVFAIPNYNRTVEKSYENEAMTQLTAIHAAEDFYKAQTGVYWPNAANQPLSAINSNLGLSITSNTLTYQCSGNSTTYSCTSTRPTFVVTVTQAPLSSASGLENPKVSAPCTGEYC